jgi:beta-glucosidase
LKLNTNKFNGKIIATIDITNTGTVPGKEVVELYISAPGKTMDKPEKELKAFGKTNLLQSGKKQTLSFTIDAGSLASFDTGRSSWVAEPGTYTVKVGASSRNIKQKATFSLDKEIIVEKDHKALSPKTDVDKKPF